MPARHPFYYSGFFFFFFFFWQPNSAQVRTKSPNPAPTNRKKRAAPTKALQALPGPSRHSRPSRRSRPSRHPHSLPADLADLAGLAGLHVFRPGIDKEPRKSSRRASVRPHGRGVETSALAKSIRSEKERGRNEKRSRSGNRCPANVRQRQEQNRSKKLGDSRNRP